MILLELVSKLKRANQDCKFCPYIGSDGYCTVEDADSTFGCVVTCALEVIRKFGVDLSDLESSNE